jgi:hypothetical protein
MPCYFPMMVVSVSQGDNYFELDVDVGSSSVARSASDNQIDG